MEHSTIQISICLCTHNPNADRLRRTLDGLAAQTMPGNIWELVIVDNASETPLQGQLDLSNFANARIVPEPNLGHLNARLCAIGAARGAIIIHLDDDNILAPDYLERAAAAFAADPKLGALGGRVLGEFEREPASWARRFIPYIAVRDPGDQPHRTENPRRYEPWFPIGAGMAMRAEAARAWADSARNDPAREGIGRRGDGAQGGQLTGSDDIDMVMTTAGAGWAIGYDPALSLTHLIPAGRLEFKYLERMIYQTHVSSVRLLVPRGLKRPVRSWPLEYLATLACCLRDGDLHPRTLWLASRQAAGMYDGARHIQPAPQ